MLSLLQSSCSVLFISPVDLSNGHYFQERHAQGIAVGGSVQVATLDDVPPVDCRLAEC